jgi:hypothetical protein
MDDQEDVTIHKQGKKTIVTTYMLCGPTLCDGGTTTLIKEAAGCLFGLI